MKLTKYSLPKTPNTKSHGWWRSNMAMSIVRLLDDTNIYIYQGSESVLWEEGFRVCWEPFVLSLSLCLSFSLSQKIENPMISCKRGEIVFIIRKMWFVHTTQSSSLHDKWRLSRWRTIKSFTQNNGFHPHVLLLCVPIIQINYYSNWYDLERVRLRQAHYSFNFS